MKRINVKSTVGPDGVLNLTLPIGKEEANREVNITVRPVDDAGGGHGGRRDWRRFVETTAGSIDDPTFKRHAQGQLEDREDLFP